MMKDATFDEFIATIYAVAFGEKVLPPHMSESLFAQIAIALHTRLLDRRLLAAATCVSPGVL